MKLSREQMLEVIENGGSIILNVGGIHKHFSKDNLAEFPSVADLALGDKEAEAAAKKELEEKLAELQAEMAKIKAKEDAADKVIEEAKAEAKAEEVKSKAKTKKADSDSE